MRRIAYAATALVVLCVAGFAWAQFSIEGQAKKILDGLVAKPPGTFTSFKYRDVGYNIAERKLVVTGLEMANGDAKQISLERLELVDFNPAAIEKIADLDLYRNGKGDGAFARIATDGTLSGLRFREASERIALAEVRIKQLSGRQFAEAPTAAAFKDDPGKGSALLLEAFIAESVSLSGFTASKDGKESVRLTRFTITDYDAGRFGDISLQGLQVIERDVDQVVIQSVRLAGLDLRPALPDLMAGRTIATHDPSRKPVFDEFRLQGVSGQGLDDQGIKFGDLVIAAKRTGDRMKEQFSLKLGNLEFRKGKAPGNQVGQILDALGYTSVPLDVDCNGSNDYAARTSMVDKCDFRLAGAATLSLAYKVGGIKPDAFDQGTDAMAAAIQDMQLLGAQIVVRDQSLVERALSFAAKQDRKTAEAKRAELIQQLRLGSAGVTQGSPRLQAAVQAAVAFLTKPGTLTLELAPAAPVRFGEFNVGMAADPPAAAEKLGLSVKASP